MCGCPSRLNRMRSIALASVAVPTVERAFAPIRSWSTMIAVVSPSSTSTSGRASVGMNPCTNALYVSLIMRCDSAAIVPNTSELLPEPDTPVNTVSRRFGISTLTSLRLFSRAPCTRIRSWLSAVGTAEHVCAPGRRPSVIGRSQRAPGSGSCCRPGRGTRSRGARRAGRSAPAPPRRRRLELRERVVEIGGGEVHTEVAALRHHLGEALRSSSVIPGPRRAGAARSQCRAGRPARP